tara:strand:- start:3250 stop:3462 length:213 start_codon:yes stop_codon:yes gene_type:complete
MGIIFKDQDGNILDGNGNPEIKNDIDGMGIPLNKDGMTEHMWSIINENTELQQQVTMLKYQLDQIKKMLG